MVPPPIHPRVRLADNGGKFFVLCFQPVTFPCALCAQVTRASARETMGTADSRSARDRHWKSRALGTPCTVQTHSPHSGDRRARPRPGRTPEGLHLCAGEDPRAIDHIRIEAPPPARVRGSDRNDHLWDLAADCKEPCIPLRSGSYDSSSMVKGPS